MGRSRQLVAYYLSWPVFAAGALALVALCAPCCLLPRGERRARYVRRGIQRAFGVWVRWLRAVDLIRIEGFEGGPGPAPAVYIANHPGLLDATFLLSRLPNAVCLVKPAVLRNPLLGLLARLAGYVSTEGGVDSVRHLAERVAAGASVLIFPEGTRTRPGRILNPFKAGFALVACRAHVPVQVVVIRCPSDLLPAGARWWRPPSFPVPWRMEPVGSVAGTDGESAAALARRAESLLLSALRPAAS